MLNGDAHHSTEVEGELRIRPLLVCERARRQDTTNSVAPPPPVGEWAAGAGGGLRRGLAYGDAGASNPRQ
jgi:hypothetical protein